MMDETQLVIASRALAKELLRMLADDGSIERRTTILTALQLVVASSIATFGLDLAAFVEGKGGLADTVDAMRVDVKQAILGKLANQRPKGDAN